jgi:hypothetical protein
MPDSHSDVGTCRPPALIQKRAADPFWETGRLMQPANRTRTSSLLRLRKRPSGKTSRAVHCEPAPSADGGEHGKRHAPNTPAKRALAVLDTPAPAEPLPPRRISKKVRAAIDAMMSGRCKRICDAQTSRSRYRRKLRKRGLSHRPRFPRWLSRSSGRRQRSQSGPPSREWLPIHRDSSRSVPLVTVLAAHLAGPELRADNRTDDLALSQDHFFNPFISEIFLLSAFEGGHPFPPFSRF